MIIYERHIVSLIVQSLLGQLTSAKAPLPSLRTTRKGPGSPTAPVSVAKNSLSSMAHMMSERSLTSEWTNCLLASEKAHRCLYLDFLASNFRRVISKAPQLSTGHHTASFKSTDRVYSVYPIWFHCQWHYLFQGLTPSQGPLREGGSDDTGHAIAPRHPIHSQPVTGSSASHTAQRLTAAFQPPAPR